MRTGNRPSPSVSGYLQWWASKYPMVTWLWLVIIGSLVGGTVASVILGRGLAFWLACPIYSAFWVSMSERIVRWWAKP